jgi:hypothetical protein
MADAEHPLQRQRSGRAVYPYRRRIDQEETVATTLGITHSPSNSVLGRDGHILVEGQRDDDGPIWEPLASRDGNIRAALPSKFNITACRLIAQLIGHPSSCR